MEYSYYRMALACGINMMESQLLQENGRNHFMTRRFDRSNDGAKYFVQTHAALNHFDYYETGAFSYEQIIMTMRELGMPMAAIEQQVLRTIFNLVACNQDDHVKNFGYLMDRKGRWSLSPAYDLCHAEGSDFTRTHQLSLNGETADFQIADLKHLAEYAGLPRNSHKNILKRIIETFAGWESLAAELNIPARIREHVLDTLRMDWR